MVFSGVAGLQSPAAVNRDAALPARLAIADSLAALASASHRRYVQTAARSAVAPTAGTAAPHKGDLGCAQSS
jgi:hypothetical protein